VSSRHGGLAFTPAERRVIRRLRTPRAVQDFLNHLAYNTEPPPFRAMLRTFRSVVHTGTAHCLEAALTAAVILEQHGYPPTVMSLESIDGLDHVIFVYRRAGRWGAVARTRDPGQHGPKPVVRTLRPHGLHGRKPVFRTLRHLALTYFDPFVDLTGCLKAYGAVDLRVLDPYDWRLATGNVWKVERLLFEIPHRPIRSSPARVRRLRARYRQFLCDHPGMKPVFYDRSAWTSLKGTGLGLWNTPGTPL
jgi:hypothetical protein